MADLTALAATLQQQVASLQPGNEQQRQDLLEAAQRFVRAVETPYERVGRMCYLDNYLFHATRVLVDLDAFGILVGAGKPMTTAEVAMKAGADRTLVERLLKHVCTQDFVKETGADEYEANDTTKVLASSEGQGVVIDMFNASISGGHSFPTFLKETGYANPTDKDNSIWKHGSKTGKHYFDWLGTPGNEKHVEAFQGHMRFKTWGLKWHQVPELMSAVFGQTKSSEEDILIVDVGGSSGFDLMGFRAAHPDMPGRLILQDLPASIEAVNKDELGKHKIEPMAHNFFTPEPVEDARVYYLKMILHDWPDKQCIEILSNIKTAMRPGHSRILLNEIIIPDTSARWFETSVDMIMLSAHSAYERREKVWRRLVEEVGGLKLVKVWDVPGAIEKVIEIEVQE